MLVASLSHLASALKRYTCKRRKKGCVSRDFENGDMWRLHRIAEVALAAERDGAALVDADGHRRSGRWRWLGRRRRRRPRRWRRRPRRRRRRLEPVVVEFGFLRRVGGLELQYARVALLVGKPSVRASRQAVLAATKQRVVFEQIRRLQFRRASDCKEGLDADSVAVDSFASLLDLIVDLKLDVSCAAPGQPRLDGKLDVVVLIQGRVGHQLRDTEHDGRVERQVEASPLGPRQPPFPCGVLETATVRAVVARCRNGLCGGRRRDERVQVEPKVPGGLLQPRQIGGGGRGGPVVVLIGRIRKARAGLLGVGLAGAFREDGNVEQTMPPWLNGGIVARCDIDKLVKGGMLKRRHQARVAVGVCHPMPTASVDLPLDSRPAQQGVGDLHVVGWRKVVGRIRDLLAHVFGRVSNGVLDHVLERGVAHDVPPERKGTSPVSALPRVLLEVARGGDVVFGIPSASLDGIAQLTERAVGEQRAKLGERHLVATRILFAIDVPVRLPDVCWNGAPFQIRSHAVVVKELVCSVARWDMHTRLGQKGLGKERRGHEQQVAVPWRRVLRVVDGAGVVWALGTSRGRGGVGHVLNEGLAGEAKHAREPGLDHARRERVLIGVVGRREEGSRHRVL